MPVLFFLCVLAALIVPYVVWRWYDGNTREIYDGPASVVNVTLLGNRAFNKDYDYVSVALPARQSMLLRVSKARLATLKTAGITEVVVTVRQPPIGDEYIHSVIWPGETKVEVTERSGAPIAIGLYFLFFGMLTLVFMPTDVSPLMHHAALYTSALVLAIGGYAFTRMSLSGPPRDAGEMQNAQSRFFGIPLGRGKNGLLVMTLVCLALNAVLFWSPSILLLIGLNTAFALGACVAHLQRALPR